MPTVARILLSGFTGTIVCGFLTFLMFFLLTVFDGNKPVEAFAYALLVGVAGAVVGVIIGLVIGAGNLGAIGGAVAGFLATLIVVTFYVVSVGTRGRYGYFLSESRIIFIVMAMPTILTGVITAVVKKLIYKT